MQPTSIPPQCRLSISTTSPPPILTTPNPVNLSARRTDTCSELSPKYDAMVGMSTGKPWSYRCATPCPADMTPSIVGLFRTCSGCAAADSKDCAPMMGMVAGLYGGRHGKSSGGVATLHLLNRLRKTLGGLLSIGSVLGYLTNIRLLCIDPKAMMKSLKFQRLIAIASRPSLSIDRAGVSFLG